MSLNETQVEQLLKKGLLLLEVDRIVVESWWGLRQVRVQEKGLDY